MHILVLCPYPPYPPRSGGALRIYNLLIGLAKRHTVCCLTFAPDDEAVAALEPLRDHCRVITVGSPPSRSLTQRARTTLTAPQPDMALRNVSPAFSATLRQLLSDQLFDLVQAESIEMAQYGMEVGGWGMGDGRRETGDGRRGMGDRSWERGRAHGPKLILDQFNAEYVLQRRAALTDLANLRSAIRRPRSLLAGIYSLIQWRKLASYERSLLRNYDHALAVSEEDRQALLRLHPAAQISIVPNGVDTSFFQPQPSTSQPQPPKVVFTGSMDFRPNIDAVTWFVQHVLPLIRAQHPTVRFVIVGRSPAPTVRALHDAGTVAVVGEVVDVRPYVTNAAVYVVPMRIGGGVRLKLLEALAMQAPIVSTTMGAEGVAELRDGEHLLMADTSAAFAAAILRLLDDARLRLQLGTNGRKLVCAHYDWQVIVPRLEAVYANMASASSPVRSEPV